MFSLNSAKREFKVCQEGDEKGTKYGLVVQIYNVNIESTSLLTSSYGNKANDVYTSSVYIVRQSLQIPHEGRFFFKIFCCFKLC